MSFLALPVVVLSMALGAAWVTGAVVFPLWTHLCTRWPRLARTAVLTATIPAVAAAAMVVGALVPGDPHIDHLFGCHCASSMPQWLHLCPVHPGSAAGLVPAAAVLLMLVVPGRLARWRELATEPVGRGTVGGPVVTDLVHPTALLVGWLRPSIAVDRQFWSGLTAPERRAVIAHESAHLARCDPQLLMLLRLLTSLAPTWAAGPFLRTWLQRAELEADAIAAHRLGSPLDLAQALIRCARLGGAHAARLGCGGGILESRVAALLGGGDRPAQASPDLGVGDAAVLGGLVVLGMLLTPWLHHELEHLLNLPL